MPKKVGTKKKVKTTTKTKIINRNKNTNINNVHVHVEKPKPRKKRVSKPKEDVPKNNLITSSSSLSQGVSQKISHQRGLVNNELQQPTIIQQIQSIPDPRIDKLEKRTKKIKDYLKDKGDTKDNAINVNSPKFQDAFETPSGTRNSNSRLIAEETITPNMLDFNTVNKPKKKNLLSLLFSSSKKKVPATELTKRDQDPFKDAIESPKPLLLEYKPEKPGATAPDFYEEANGIKITKELKNLVNQLHASHPHSKLQMAPFRSAIARKLKELGVSSSHTNAYVNQMRKFYDEVFALSQGTEAAGGVM
jgi:hypothetical protein